jgi:glutathione S-transferase
VTLTLHDYPASANCLKVRLLLGLLGREYRRVEVDIFDGATLTDEYAALNPLRETPVLVTPDDEVVTQSNAIAWLLAEGTPFLPAGALGRAQVVQWLLFEQERVMPGLGNPRFRLLTGRAALDPDGVAARQEIGREALAILEAQLTARPFLVGHTPTIADLAVYAYTHVADEGGVPLAPFSAVTAWIERLEALPGFANDLAPYPANASPGAGRSIYDPAR